MIIQDEAYYDKLDEAIKKAKDNRNALPYFLLCNEAGIEPELNDLYKQGMVELEYSKKGLEGLIAPMESTRKRTVPDEVYKEFYEEAEKFKDSPYAFDEMRDVLVKYFPRFREDGKTPIKDYQWMQVKNTFNYIIQYTEKRIKKN